MTDPKADSLRRAYRSALAIAMFLGAIFGKSGGGGSHA